MHLRSAALASAFALSLGISIAPHALAQSDSDRATARSLGQDGQQALDNKDYATAEDRFRRADKMVHAPTLMLGLARALAAEGKYVEAQEAYNRIVRDGLAPNAPDVFKRALDDAKKEVDAVSAKVGSVVITVKAAAGGTDVPDPQVFLDEHPINSASLGVRRAIDPGPHVLRATAEGYAPGELKFSATQGMSIDEPLLLEKSAMPIATPAPTLVPVNASAVAGSDAVAPAPPSKARKILPWVAFGVGGAGLVVGGVTGVLAMGKHSTLSSNCDAKNFCGADQNSNLDSYHTLGTVSTIGFIVAGVGGAVGAVLLLTQPKGDSVAPATTGLRIVPVVGLGSVGATGSF